jgi:hypothetical protein
VGGGTGMRDDAAPHPALRYARATLPARGRANDLGRAALHLIASGLIGEPVPPVMTSGGAQKKNS